MPGPRLPTLAWRNIWRNRRRTLITLVGIAFGTLLAVLSTGIGDSSYAEMIDYAARLGGGHVVVQHADYQKLPALNKTVAASEDLLQRVAAHPDVRAVVPRIRGGAMLATSSNNVGSGFIGIDPALESNQTLGLLDALAEGEMFATADDEGIILGRALAENLDVGLGKKVVYTLTNKDGEIVSGLSRVSGILDTGAAEVDSGICLLPLRTLQQLLGYAPGEVTQIAVFLDNHRDATEIAHQIGADLQGQLGSVVTALPWDEAMPDLAGFVTMKVTGSLIMQLIITLLITAGIFNTLFVSVMERMRELGILAAIGFTSRQLFALVVWESLWIACCGIVAGVLLTAWPYYYLATTGFDTAAMTGTQAGTQVSGITMSQVLYVEIYPDHAAVIGVAIVLATLLAGIYPAYRAGRVSPVEAIRTV